jgi:hypothetical protein
MTRSERTPVSDLASTHLSLVAGKGRLEGGSCAAGWESAHAVRSASEQLPVAHRNDVHRGRREV